MYGRKTACLECRGRRWEHIVRGNIMRRCAFACLLILSVILPALAAELTVLNSSDYVIHHLYISPSASRNWGQDQLGKAIIGRADRFTVRNIPDGTYDLKIVDEDEDECIVERVDITGNMTWTLTDSIIESCVKK
jgi:hypothetical protein